MSDKGSSKWRIVLLGETGAGKSATGNDILGGEYFTLKHYQRAVTDTCNNGEANVFGKTLSITNTPGLFDTSMTERKLKTEIEKCIFMSAPHVFLLVIRLDERFSKEQKDTVKWIQENFGEEATRYLLILFTHADVLGGTSFDEFIKENPDLKALIGKSPYHSFSNSDRQNQNQVKALLEKIEQMVKRNNGTHYTNEMYKKAQRKIKLKKGIKIGGIVLGTAVLIGVTGGVGAAIAAGAGAVAVGAGAGAVAVGAGAGAVAVGAGAGAAAVGVGAAAATGVTVAGGVALGATAVAMGTAAGAIIADEKNKNKQESSS